MLTCRPLYFRMSSLAGHYTNQGESPRLWSGCYSNSLGFFVVCERSCNMYISPLSMGFTDYHTARTNDQKVWHTGGPACSRTCRARNFGVRRQWLRHLAMHFTDHVIYICKDNKDRLTGPMPHSTILYNPIPFDKFNRKIDGAVVRRKLCIPETAHVLFFPGGSNFGIKGIVPFLKALEIVRKKKCVCHCAWR